MYKQIRRMESELHKNSGVKAFVKAVKYADETKHMTIKNI